MARATRLVILGAGGFAREVLDVADAIEAARPGTLRVEGFVSEREDEWGDERNGLPVLGGFEWLASAPRAELHVVCGIGAPAVRRRVTERCEALGLSFATLVHPRATLGRAVEIGTGSIVTAGVVLTNQIRVGRHVHLNLNATVGHDAEIADLATIAPGVNVSGNVHVGEGVDLGTGAAILQRVRIGAWSVVGAGAVVHRDLPACCTAVGVPAEVIKTREEGWWRNA